MINSLPDNCIFTISKKVCLINKIIVVEKTSEETVHFEGLSAVTVDNLYSVPMLSSDLNIFFCKGLSEKSATTFSQKDIYCKGFLIPHKNGHAFFPLNHY